MSKIVYGLDFGTTNTAVAIVRDNAAEVLPIGVNGLPTIPSLIFFPEFGGEALIGQHAIDGYLNSGMNGRLMQAIKSFLPDKNFKGTDVGGQIGFATLEKLISLILEFVKSQADACVGEQVSEVVLGRPALFSPDPEKDALAETRLVAAAHLAGFEQVHVQREPIAAAFDYERRIAGEEAAFIADFGGGTSDFTIMRLGPDHVDKTDRVADILGVDGVYVGGNNFDASIMWHKLTRYFGSESEFKEWGKWLPMPRHLMQDLCRWQRITFLKDRKTRAFIQHMLRTSNDPEAIKRLMTLIEENLGFSLFQVIEQAKRNLSSDMQTQLMFNESVIAIEERISRPEFDDLSHAHTTEIKACIDQLIATVGLSVDRIDSFFVTGGTSYIPAVRQVLIDTFGIEKIRTGDAFISVAAGLALSRSNFA